MGRALVLVGLTAIVGCSSSGGDSSGSSSSTSSGTLPVSDGGTSSSSGLPSSSTSGSPSSSTSSTSSSGGDPVAACITACEAKHPKGKMLGSAIDTCWSKSCSSECNGIGTGKNEEPDHGSCQNVVSTPAKDCSQCTVDHCCAAWDACFNDTDCTALNTCTNACYK